MEIKITFTGETLEALKGQMVLFLGDTVTSGAAGNAGPTGETGDPAPAPRKRTTTLKKPKPEAEAPAEEESSPEAENEAPETETAEDGETVDLAVVRKDAVNRLMALYTRGGAVQNDVKDLLAVFGVKKFSEVSAEQVNDLLDAAVALEKKHEE